MTVEAAIKLLEDDSGLCEVLKHTRSTERDLIFAARGEIKRRRIGRGYDDITKGDMLIMEAGAMVFRYLQAFPCQRRRTRINPGSIRADRPHSILRTSVLR